jgi:hypothetical protein
MGTRLGPSSTPYANPFVLDLDLRVIAARRSFYRSFAVTPRKTEGQLVFELGAGHWDAQAANYSGEIIGNVKHASLDALAQPSSIITKANVLGNGTFLQL